MPFSLSEEYESYEESEGYGHPGGHLDWRSGLNPTKQEDWPVAGGLLRRRRRDDRSATIQRLRILLSPYAPTGLGHVRPHTEEPVAKSSGAPGLAASAAHGVDELDQVLIELVRLLDLKQVAGFLHDHHP